MKSEFSLWLDLAGKASDEELFKKETCPSCHSSSLDFQYVVRASDRLGYLDVWCNSCKKGIHISRVTAPQGASVIDLNAPNEELAARIPPYNQVVP